MSVQASLTSFHALSLRDTFFLCPAAGFCLLLSALWTQAVIQSGWVMGDGKDSENAVLTGEIL